MFGIGHIDMMPVFYGIVMFIGIWSMWHKFEKGYWRSLIGEVSVFSLVFMLHGGSMAGGFAAMVAALIAGMTLFRPRIIKRRK